MQKSWFATVLCAIALLTGTAQAQDGTLQTGFVELWEGGNATTGFTGTVGSHATAGQTAAILESKARAFTGVFAEGRLFGIRKVIADIGVEAEATRTGRTLSGARSCARTAFRVLGRDIMPMQGRCDLFGSQIVTPMPNEKIATEVFVNEKGTVTFAGLFSADLRVRVVGSVGLRWRAEVINNTRERSWAMADANAFSNLYAEGSVEPNFLGFGINVTARMTVIEAEVIPSHTAGRAFGTDIDPNPAINTYYSVRTNAPIKVKGLDGKITAKVVTPIIDSSPVTIWNPKPLINKSLTVSQFNHVVARSSFVP